GGGIALGVVLLSAGTPLAVAAAPVIATAAVSFTRVGGHPTWEWLPLLTAWIWSRLHRGRRWVAPLPLWTSTEGPAPMPPCLHGPRQPEPDGRRFVSGAAGRRDRLAYQPRSSRDHHRRPGTPPATPLRRARRRRTAPPLARFLRRGAPARASVGGPRRLRSAR